MTHLFIKKQISIEIKEMQEKKLTEQHPAQDDHYWLHKLNSEIEDEISKTRSKEDDAIPCVSADEDWLFVQYKKIEKK